MIRATQTAAGAGDETQRMPRNPITPSPQLLRAMQLKSLEMFRYLEDFCKQEGLLIYFCGGCCIGAVRHEGFIPWDDDVDVFMPRESYERLWELWSTKADTTRYQLIRPTQDCVTGDIMMKLCDETTTVIKTYQVNKDIPQGLTLDILPLDGCPSGWFARKAQLAWCLIFSLFCAQQVPVNHGGAVAAASRFLLALVRSPRSRYRVWSRAEKRMSRYAIEACDYLTELCAGPHYMRNRYPKEAFARAVQHVFEDGMAPLPVGYDDYLRIAFGDYMELPPLDKRIPQHDCVFCDLEVGYRTYRGVEYCVGEGFDTTAHHDSLVNRNLSPNE